MRPSKKACEPYLSDTTHRLLLFAFSNLLCFTQLDPSSSALQPSPAILYFNNGEKTGRAFPFCLAIAGSWAFPDLHFFLHSDEVRNPRSHFPVDLLPIPVEHCIRAPCFVCSVSGIGEDTIGTDLGARIAPAFPDTVKLSGLTVVWHIEIPCLSALPDGELSGGRGHNQVRILHQDLHTLLHKAPRTVSRKAGRAV